MCVYFTAVKAKERTDKTGHNLDYPDFSQTRCQHLKARMFPKWCPTIGNAIQQDRIDLLNQAGYIPIKDVKN